MTAYLQNCEREDVAAIEMTYFPDIIEWQDKQYVRFGIQEKKGFYRLASRFVVETVKGS